MRRLSSWNWLCQASAIGVLVLGASRMAGASPSETPDRVVQQTASQVLNEIRKNKASLSKDPEALYALASSLVLPHFDIDYMSQLVLGRYWREATPDQKQRFNAAFTRMLVNTYGHALLAYESERIQWDAGVSVTENDATVRTTVVPKGGPEIPINYSLHVRNDTWQVYDIEVDAISLVTNYRASFAAEIKKNGLDSLIGRLEQKAKSR